MVALYFVPLVKSLCGLGVFTCSYLLAGVLANRQLLSYEDVVGLRMVTLSGRVQSISLDFFTNWDHGSRYVLN